MAIEIERKFLVNHLKWEAFKQTAFFKSIDKLEQGYLSSSPEKTIRVRRSNQKAFLTIKGKTEGIARLEFEYEIPVSEAEILLLNFADSSLSKTRFTLVFEDKTWEIDEFDGVNSGLIIAEIELSSVDEKFCKPDWLGKEVSEDERYYNSNLTIHPYQSW